MDWICKECFHIEYPNFPYGLTTACKRNCIVCGKLSICLMENDKIIKKLKKNFKFPLKKTY